MKAAFKEWAVVCKALATGRQILILRKGGIVEPGGAFRIEYPEFLLFPTYLHQNRAGIRSEAMSLWDEVARDSSEPGKVRLDHFAWITDAYEIHDEAALSLLRDEHAWSDALVSERFHRWHKEAVHALLVRVLALATPHEIPLSDSHAGCKSWIELEEDIPTAGATPVLNDAEYESRAAKIRDRLGKSSATAR